MSGISLPPKGNDAKILGAYFSPLKVEALATPTMQVKVAEGAFWTADNEHQEFIGGISPLLSAPGTDAKWVLLTVTPNGALNLIDGTASTNPSLPDVALYKDELPLAAIFVGDTVTAITNDMIYDIRPMWQIPPDSVSQTQLNDFATITYVNNGLATKAKTDGTAEANFTLNVGAGSINDSGIYVDRQAGPDVAIRFNELATSGSPAVVTPQWEFTNDGATWNAIGVSAGNYYLKTELDAGALDFLYYQQNQLTGAAGTGVLDSRYYEQADADALFSVLAHTHSVADITDLNAQVETVNLITPVSGDVSLNINDILDVQNLGPAFSHVLTWSTTNSKYENRQLNSADLSDVDTTTISPVAGDVIIHSGGLFVNRPIVKDDISDFTGGEFVLTTNVAGDAPAGDGPPDSNGTPQDIYGVKTFKDGVVIETSLVVTGANTTIETTTLTVADDHVDINSGELADGVGGGSGTSGIRVDRGFGVGSPIVANSPAILQWDENAGQWEIGVEGSVSPIISGAHTHVVAELVDFNTGVTAQLTLNDLNTIADVAYLAAPVDRDHLIYNFSLTRWENSVFSTDVTTELNTNTLEELQDVSYTTAVSGEILMWGGSPASWSNHLPVKADISDFVEADYIHATTDEVKSGDLVLIGDFTVTGGVGSETRLESEHVYISDTVITLNEGETGNGVAGGSGTAGIEVHRGATYTKSMLRWDEGAGVWTITEGTGALLTSGVLETVGHDHLLTDITDISAFAAEVNYLSGTSANVQVQIDDKISRNGDTMNAGANLTFTVTGEVLGLPALPSDAGAATSRQYVDDQITVAAGSLATHAADMTLHITAAQNTFLDALTLTGSPALLAADVNNLIGISGNVQASLDLKANRTAAPATTGNLAALDVNGDLVDSLVIVNDAVSALTTIWTSNEIDDRKPNKVPPALTGNLAGLSLPNGDLIDSGLILNDGGTLVTEIWSAQKIDTVKANKIAPVATNNLASLDVAGNLQDAGVLINDAAASATTIMWTSDKIDTAKADKILPLLTSNLAGLDAVGNLEDSGVIINDSGSGLTHIWTANKIDATKANKVGGATIGNFAEFNGSGDIVDNGNSVSTFAATGHTHVAANITDFNAALNTYITTLAILDDISDVAVAGVVADDILVRNAGNTDWIPSSALTFFGTDFVRSSGSIAESITGVKTFNDDTAFGSNVVVTGDLTVNGTTTTLDSINLEVTDKNILVNAGYSGPTSGSTGAGLNVNRNDAGGSPAVLDLAALIWDDSIERWKGGLEAAEDVIALEGVTIAQPFWEMTQAPAQAGSPVLPQLVYNLGFGVPAPAAGSTGLQVFVNGVKQIEGAGKTYTVNYGNPSQTVVTFTSVGAAPTIGADVEFYGFGYIT